MFTYNLKNIAIMQLEMVTKFVVMIWTNLTFKGNKQHIVVLYKTIDKLRGHTFRRT